jgi:hypothetical protein
MISSAISLSSSGNFSRFVYLNDRSWPLAAISNAEIRGNRIAAFGWIAELRLKQLPIAASDPEQPLGKSQSKA